MSNLTVPLTGGGKVNIATDLDIVNQTSGSLIDAPRILDEDNMVSDSNVHVPTQQSVVAYVANQLAGGVTYRGVMPIPADLTTSSTGNAYADSSTKYLVGDMFIASADGQVTMSDGSITVGQGDALIINTEVNKAGITIAMVDDIASSRPEPFSVGDYKESAISVDHDGWLLCDGSAKSRTTYSDLFSRIGITFGSGDGATTFNLPNTIDRVSGNASPTNPLGTVSGNDNITLSTSNLPSHNHTINHDHSIFTSNGGGSHSHTYTYQYKTQDAPYGDSVRTVWEFVQNITGTTSAAPDHTHDIDIPNFTGNSGNTGSGQSFDNRQKTIYDHYKFIYAGV
jgi:microcystin-dependent protein